MIYRIFDTKTGKTGIISAFDINAARRKTKKVLKVDRIPKRIWVMPVSQQEIEKMIQSQVKPVEASEEALAKVEELQERAEELALEGISLTEEVKEIKEECTDQCEINLGQSEE